jgi:hypothetical protein
MRLTDNRKWQGIRYRLEIILMLFIQTLSIILQSDKKASRGRALQR